ncbi:MAG: universal stress protein [Terriglobia bacterium]
MTCLREDRYPDSMQDFKRILFPVDFSRQCTGTIPFVKEMVGKFAAALTLFHVVQIPVDWYGTMSSPAMGYGGAFEEYYRLGEQHMAAFRSEHFGDTHSVATICEWGDPGDAILARAEKADTDLIMMATRGHGPFAGFLLGSTAAKVLHRAVCPVWTAAHLDSDGEDLPAAHVRVRNILCAVDLEKDSGHVIQSAAALADKLSAEVRLVHCVPASEGGPAAKFDFEFNRFLVDSARQGLARMQAEVNSSFEVFLAFGSVSKVVRDEALSRETDLVVVGRGHVKSPFSRLRSNAYAIIRDAPCPVLSL